MLVAPFHWIDYRGGALTEAAGGDFTSSDVERLVEQIDISNAVLFFADAFILSHYLEVADIELARFYAGIDSMFRVFRSYHEAHKKRQLMYLVVLTKCDGLGIEEPKQYEKLLNLGEEAFQPVIKEARRAGWNGGIVGVSAAGIGRVKRELIEPGGFRTLPQVSNQLIGPAKPVNVDVALFHCIATIFDKMLIDAEQSAAVYDRRIDEALERDSFIKRLLGAITGTDSPSEIASRYRKLLRQEERAARHYEKYLRSLSEQSGNVVRRIR